MSVTLELPKPRFQIIPSARSVIYIRRNISTVICKNLVSAKVNKIELDIGREGSDYAASIGAIRISVPCFKTEMFQQQKLSISTRLNDLSM